VFLEVPRLGTSRRRIPHYGSCLDIHRWPAPRVPRMCTPRMSQPLVEKVRLDVWTMLTPPRGK
jgi:hypothetical protein